MRSRPRTTRFSVTTEYGDEVDAWQGAPGVHPDGCMQQQMKIQ